MFRHRFVLILASLWLTACSVWQNASRKYMEKQSYDYAGIKVHEENFVGCGHPTDLAGWVEASRDERTLSLERQIEARFELRVTSLEAGAASCDYVFSSAEDRASGRTAAIADALEHLGDI